MTTRTKIRYKDGFSGPPLLSVAAADTPDDPSFVPLEEREEMEKARYFARRGMAKPAQTTGEFHRQIPERSSPWMAE